jgi:cell division protein FtsN
MPKHSPAGNQQNDSRQERWLRRLDRWVIPVLLLALVGGLPGCLFKKKKAAAPTMIQQGPIRIVFLPANIAAEDTGQRWLSLAVPVLLTKLATLSPDLEPVPLWQLLPVAAENAGASRTINPELTSYMASRMGGWWGTMAEITPSKNGFTLVIDFVPVRTSDYAFRFQKDTSANSLESDLRAALEEFLHYRLPEPAMSRSSSGAMDMGLVRQVAEVLDNDYGWFVQPSPGKGEAVAASLAGADKQLAPLVLSPTLYPVVGSLPAPPPAPIKSAPPIPPPPVEEQKPPGKSEVTPAPAAPTPAMPAEEPAHPAASAQAAPVQPEIQLTVEVPPPKTFTLRVTRPRPPSPAAPREALTSGSSRASPAPARAGPPSGSGSTSREAKARAPLSEKPILLSESASPHTSANSPFRIQIGSMRDRTNAEAEAQRLAKEGLKSEVVETELEGTGTWYRVYLTGFHSRREAISAGRKLQAKGLIQAFLPSP